MMSHGAAHLCDGPAEFKISDNHQAKRARISRRRARAGKANLAVTELLARYFAIPKSRITIIRGHTSRRKIIELAES